MPDRREIAIAPRQGHPDRCLATVAAHSARASKLIAADRRVFALRPPHLPQGVDAVLVLIDTDEELVDVIHERLTQDIARGAEDWIIPGNEEAHLSLLLDRAHALAASNGRAPAVAIAVWVREEVVIGYSGTARVYLVRDGVVVEPELPRREPSDTHEARIGRIAIAHTDRLALASSEVVGCVGREELQEILLAKSSVASTASWLVTLASSRGHDAASALIAELAAPPSDAQEATSPPVPGRKWYRSQLFWLGLAIGIVILSLLLATMLLSSSSKPHAGRARPLQAPTALRAQQVSATQVVFSWRSVPHATAYLLQVGLDQFYTRGSRTAVSDVLEPGKGYTWWVQSKSPSQTGPRSGPASLRLRPLPARWWRFYPLSTPVDQALLTLYNPNGTASDAQIQVKDAVADRKRVRVAPFGAAEIGVLPSKAGNRGLALTVRASTPLVVQRVVIRSNTTQSAYGIPEADAGGA